MKPGARTILRLSGVLLAGFVGMLAVLAAFQRSLIYLPSRQPESALLDSAAQIGMAPWRDGHGGIVGWKRPAPPGTLAANRLVVFHGNAGFALHRMHYVEGFESLDGGRLWEVLLFEYPGYGARSGSPGEKEITEAALAAFDALLAADRRPIHLVGESIGSGPACALARERPEAVAGLFLVTPMSSLGDLAAYHYPFLPVRLVLRERWDNVEALRDYRGRIAVLLAGRDEVVPNRFGRRLFDSYSGAKRLWQQEHATHNTLDFTPAASWWREVSDFLQEGRATPRP